MVANGQHGSIINLASQAGHRGEALGRALLRNQSAVISYTQSAALALAPHKIRVNAISPGVIDTADVETVDALFAKFENKEFGQKKREVGEAVPWVTWAIRLMSPALLCFLACDQSAYMTAQTIGVDGGNVLR